MQRTRESYFINPEPRKDLIANLQRQIKKERPKQQVLLSFIGDAYCETTDENALTHEVLEILLENKVPVAVLTKGGNRCLKDLELFKKYGEHIQVGATLTFDNDADSLEWENGGALPQERLDTLKTLHESGIKTFVSFEPVIDPAQSLSLIEKSLPFVDTYKIGKINNFQGLDKKINWTDFLSRAVTILRENNKAFYVKHDLRLSAPAIKLYGNEVFPDEHNVN